MSIAPRLRRYLDRCGIDYEVLPHLHTDSSLQTARAARVRPQKLAKAVLFEDDGGYVMAIVPACRRIDLERLRACLDREVELATEPELRAVFADCERGALPAIGSAYRIPSIVDESLAGLPDVYFEAGDHEDVVHMDGAAFEELMMGAARGRFTRAL